MTDDAEPYLYPDSRVLRNKPGITDLARLQRYETATVSIRTHQIEDLPIPGKFDLAHLQAIHKHLFQDVYAWAGHLRTVEIGKDGNWFAPLETPAHTLKSWGETILGNIKADGYLRGLFKPSFVDKLSKHYTELNYLHPFREGNGRSTRAFLQQLSGEAGYVLEYDRINRDEWIHAAKESYAGNREPVRGLFERIATPARAIEFEQQGSGSSLQRYPELAGAVETMRAAETYAHQIPAADPRDAFVVGVRSRISEQLRAGATIQRLERGRKADRAIWGPEHGGG